MITLNDQEVKPTVFPDKTTQVWNIDLEELSEQCINVRWDYEYPMELFNLGELKMLIDKYKKYGTYTRLTIPYLPYARQDKEVDNNNSFSLNYFAKVLNNQNWNAVLSVDVHNSRITKSLINGFDNIDPIYNFICNYNNFDTIVVFPDQGAKNRYYGPLFDAYSRKFTARKVRDQRTGKILSYDILPDDIGDKIDDYLGKNMSVLVLDDICDGGATFILLGEKLKSLGFTCDLYVTHGIFSKGLDDLYKYYDTVYTTNTLSKFRENNPSLKDAFSKIDGPNKFKVIKVI